MTVRIPAGSLVIAACGALLVALSACGSSTASPTASSAAASSETASSAAASSETVEVPAPPPSAEPSGPEQPQKPNVEVVANLPSLPVGGVEPVKDNPTCVPVGWASNPIPDGVRIMITGVDVTGINDDDIHEAPACRASHPATTM